MQFVKDPTNPEWLPRLPMVKASVLAMDTIQDFAKKQFQLQIDSFTVSGASKRGWTGKLLNLFIYTFTAWLVAAVDNNRVKAVVPMVIPIMKNVKVFTHVFNSICYFPESMQDYINENATSMILSPQFAKIAEIEDPWNYVSRLHSTRKYSINALGDEFFDPDLSKYNFLEMPGLKKNKHQYYIPNAGHSMNADAWRLVASFNYAVLHGIELPTYTFNHLETPNGVHIEVTIINGKIPTSVKLWKATNTKERDFRSTTIGAVWTSIDINAISENQSNTFKVFVPKPNTGFTAASVELTFDQYFEDKTLPYLKFSTDTFITPNIFPCSYPNPNPQF